MKLVNGKKKKIWWILNKLKVRKMFKKQCGLTIRHTIMSVLLKLQLVTNNTILTKWI